MKKPIVLMSFAIAMFLTSFQAHAGDWICQNVAKLFEENLQACRSTFALQACDDCEFYGNLLSSECGGEATPEEIFDLCIGVW